MDYGEPTGFGGNWRRVRTHHLVKGKKETRTDLKNNTSRCRRKRSVNTGTISGEKDNNEGRGNAHQPDEKISTRMSVKRKERKGGREKGAKEDRRFRRRKKDLQKRGVDEIR